MGDLDVPEERYRPLKAVEHAIEIVFENGETAFGSVLRRSRMVRIVQGDMELIFFRFLLPGRTRLLAIIYSGLVG